MLKDVHSQCVKWQHQDCNLVQLMTRLSSQDEELKNREKGDLDDFPNFILDNWICHQRGTALSPGVVRAGGQRPMQRWDGRMTNITHFSSILHRKKLLVKNVEVKIRIYVWKENPF